MPDALALVPSETRNPPTIPFAWDYDASVGEVKQLVYKWKNITLEIADELFIAREKLRKQGRNNGDRRTWTDYCGEIGVERMTVHRWLDRVFGENVTDDTFLPPPPLPTGTYDVILADPPWRYDFAETDSRAIENQYPTLTPEEIIAYQPPAAPDAVLFLWATAPKLREALEVVAGWGFEYVTHMIWVKDKIGMGYYARSKHELLLIGRRGEPGVPAESVRPDSVFESPRTVHSRKPDRAYELIETMYPDRAYLEMFSRSEREGWQGWGNEV